MVKEQICNLTSMDDFIQSLYNDLFEYVENNPECTLEEIIDTFGNPEDIAREFLLEAEDFKPNRIAKVKKRRGIIIAGLIILLVLGGIYIIKIHGHTQADATDVIVIYE